MIEKVLTRKVINAKNLAGDTHLPKRPRKSLKLDFRYLVPKK